MERQRPNAIQPQGRLRRALARFDAKIVERFIDPEARQMGTISYTLSSARRSVVERKFQRRPEAWGGTADIVRGAVHRIVTRYERRQRIHPQG